MEDGFEMISDRKAKILEIVAAILMIGAGAVSVMMESIFVFLIASTVYLLSLSLIAHKNGYYREPEIVEGLNRALDIQKRFFLFPSVLIILAMVTSHFVQAPDWVFGVVLGPLFWILFLVFGFIAPFVISWKARRRLNRRKAEQASAKRHEHF